MNRLVILLFFLFFYTKSFADEKIVYLNVNLLLTSSESGIYINNELQKINKKNLDEFKKIETSIKSEEDKLLKQKNILKEDEFNNKVEILREKYKSYQKLKSKKNNDLKVLRDNSRNQILKIINEILAEYSTKNNISMVIEKKNVVIGKTDLDITKNIFNLLNIKIKKIEIK